jgi:hypothetical protein
VDTSIVRHEVEGFKFPLGVYPVEDMKPKPGYTLDFEPADGGDESGDWEEWPDRYVFDAVLSAERVPGLVRLLLGMMPAKVYPILDILGHDAFREIDPYVSWDLVGTDRIMEAIRQVPGFFYEDGLCGFGAMSEEPFLYFFVDEHKIVTIRAESVLRDKIERLMTAFGLTQTEEAAGVDSAAHEHRSVLVTPKEDPISMSFDEIVEQLRDDWRLVLNIDPETNVDDDGKDLGRTTWWCRVRVAVGAAASEEEPVKKKPATAAWESPEEDGAAEEEDEGEWATRYAEVVLSATCLREAEEMAAEAAERLAGVEDSDAPPPFVVFADRMTEDQASEYLGRSGKKKGKGGEDSGGILSVKWVR